jgi:glycosyltransferase involved in cell wall biosynthesis
MNKPTLSLVIPAFNEEENLRRTLPEIGAACAAEGWTLIVVDDGSTDGTAAAVAEYIAAAGNRSDGPKIVLLSHKVNRGYGGALKTGLRAAATDYAITLDADGQHEIGEVAKMSAEIVSTGADLVVGRRSLPGDSLYRRMGKSLLRFTAKRLLPLPVNDLNSGFKIYRTKVVQRYLNLCPDSMAFSDIVVLVFVGDNRLVREIPIRNRKRLGGKSKTGTRTAFETVFEILNIIMLFNPMRIFLPLSLICVVAGLAWGIPIVLMKRGVSVGAMLAITSGLIFFFVGLVAEQLSSLRKQLLQIKAHGGDDDRAA